MRPVTSASATGRKRPYDRSQMPTRPVVKNHEKRRNARKHSSLLFYLIVQFGLLSASELAVRTKNVNDLVHVHLLHVVTSRCEVLTWVEV